MAAPPSRFPGCLPVAGETKSVVGVLKLGGNAGAGGAACDFDVMAPGASTGGFTVARVRAGWVALGRDRIIVRLVPVAAPLVHVLADVVKAEGVGRVTGDPIGSVLPACGVVGKRFRRRIAPGKEPALHAAARCALPFGLRR